MKEPQSSHCTTKKSSCPSVFFPAFLQTTVIDKSISALFASALQSAAVGGLQWRFSKTLVQEAQKRWDRVTDFPYRERAILALPKALGQVFLHKGMEGLIPALLKALGQIFLHKGMEGPIPALLEVLGQLFLHKGME